MHAYVRSLSLSIYLSLPLPLPLLSLSCTRRLSRPLSVSLTVARVRALSPSLSLSPSLPLSLYRSYICARKRASIRPWHFLSSSHPVYRYHHVLAVVTTADASKKAKRAKKLKKKEKKSRHNKLSFADAFDADEDEGGFAKGVSVASEGVVVAADVPTAPALMYVNQILYLLILLLIIMHVAAQQMVQFVWYLRGICIVQFASSVCICTVHCVCVASLWCSVCGFCCMVRFVWHMCVSTYRAVPPCILHMHTLYTVGRAGRRCLAPPLRRSMQRPEDSRPRMRRTTSLCRPTTCTHRYK